MTPKLQTSDQRDPIGHVIHFCRLEPQIIPVIGPLKKKIPWFVGFPMPYVENPSNPKPYTTKFRKNLSKNHERKPKKVQEPSRTPQKNEVNKTFQKHQKKKLPNPFLWARHRRPHRKDLRTRSPGPMSVRVQCCDQERPQNRV